MHGYVLFVAPDGRIDRLEADQPTRRSLMRFLTDSVPLQCRTVGLVITDTEALPLRVAPHRGESRHLRSVPAS
ncbi:hypothetical protein [Frondihabitans cladoniiphilus]|uniref:Uncharacterized protein n=1 Tax=Frondihabitans cladoniiphilus TaxID=715785 RepID=A0ABP8VM08_9MICO